MGFDYSLDTCSAAVANFDGVSAVNPESNLTFMTIDLKVACR